MNELMNFDFNGTNLTTIIDEKGDPWWVAKEICEVLGHSNTTKAVKDHCKYAKIFKPNESLGLRFGPRGVNIIPEGDLMRLVTKSKLPEADKFERWVFDEVLPQIRKTGSYSVAPGTTPPMTDEILLSKALLIADGKIKKLEQTVERQEATLKQAFPVIQEHHQLMSSGKSISLTFAANVFSKSHHEEIAEFGRKRRIKDPGIGPKKLNHFLRLKKILKSRPQNAPSQKYIDKGWFIVRLTPQGFPQTMVTQLGMSKINKIDPVEILEAWEQHKFITKIINLA